MNSEDSSVVVDEFEQATRTILVKELPRGTTHANLVALYKPFGELERVTMKGRSNSALLRFAHKRDAELSLEATQKGNLTLNNKSFFAYSVVPTIESKDDVCNSPEASTTDGPDSEECTPSWCQNSVFNTQPDHAQLWNQTIMPYTPTVCSDAEDSITASSGFTQQVGPMAVCPQMKPDRTLLIAHFPRECYENDDVRRTLSHYGPISRINLISDPETKKPKCYGFVEFMEHSGASMCLEGTTRGLVVLYDQRNHPWHVKAEWTRAYASTKVSSVKTGSPDVERSPCATVVDKCEVAGKGALGPMAPSRTLLIAYFPREASKDQIAEVLSAHGKVSRVHLIVEKDTKKPKCYGFVEFVSAEAANAVLTATEQGLVTMLDARSHMWHVRAERVRAFDKDKKEGRRQEKKGAPDMFSMEDWMKAGQAPQFPANLTAHIPRPNSDGLSSDFQKEVDRQATAKAAEFMANLFSLLSKDSAKNPRPDVEAYSPGGLLAETSASSVSGDDPHSSIRDSIWAPRTEPESFHRGEGFWREQSVVSGEAWPFWA